MEFDFKPLVQWYDNDPTRLMDILIDIQKIFGFISDEAVEQVSEALGLSGVDVLQTVSFYHFFSRKPRGKYVVYLNNSAVAVMKGQKVVKQAFEREAGCKFGEVSSDGLIGLFETADIGMNDQEPAALINGIPFTDLTPPFVRELVSQMKQGVKVEKMVKHLGDGRNASPMINSMVRNNIRRKGPVLFSGYQPGSVLDKLKQFNPEEIIDEMRNSQLRGRGGAGFLADMKWDICRLTKADKRYIVCNADEGEPGTFKDRVILTEIPELMIDGMIVAGYAIGASEGIIYLRSEYDYLKNFLNSILQEYRKNNRLGFNVNGITGFHYDIRVQMGGGAYVCGEESALIDSMEGKRGEPRIRPPYPVVKGYLGKPTSVNNVETFCCAAQIISHGAQWFRSFGTEQSAGVKLLSVSGDCQYPGIYEVEWGITVNEFLKMVGAESPQAVQVGGPSGNCVGEKDFHRTISLEDLPTGGSMIVLGRDRNLADIMHNFAEFFAEESCGACAPCRIGTVLLCNSVDNIRKGSGSTSDLKRIEQLDGVMKKACRCGLGQSAARSLYMSIKNFPEVFPLKDDSAKQHENGFSLADAMVDASVASDKPMKKNPEMEE